MRALSRENIAENRKEILKGDWKASNNVSLCRLELEARLVRSMYLDRSPRRLQRMRAEAGFQEMQEQSSSPVVLTGATHRRTIWHAVQLLCKLQGLR